MGGTKGALWRPLAREGHRDVVVDEDVGTDKIWEGGRGSNYISEVDDYFDEMTDIIHAAPFFERNRKGNNFCLKEIVYNGDKHLNKTIFLRPNCFFFN